MGSLLVVLSSSLPPPELHAVASMAMPVTPAAATHIFRVVLRTVTPLSVGRLHCRVRGRLPLVRAVRQCVRAVDVGLVDPRMETFPQLVRERSHALARTLFRPVRGVKEMPAPAWCGSDPTPTFPQVRAPHLDARVTESLRRLAAGRAGRGTPPPARRRSPVSAGRSSPR